MNIAIKQSTANENTLIWAIVCSILLHILFAVVIPNLKFEHVKKPDVLEIELAPKPEPPPVVIQPESVQPLPEQPKPKVEPKPPVIKPVVKPTPVPTVTKSEPTSYIAPAVAPTEPTPAKPEAPTSPTVSTPPVVAAPQVVGPSQADMSAARDSYGNTLWNAIGKYKNYPKIAQMRSWQGEVVVELLLDGNGNLKSKKVLKGSGYDILDKEALAMVDKAAPFPPPPEALLGSSFSIKVPIPFKLE